MKSKKQIITTLFFILCIFAYGQYSNFHNASDNKSNSYLVCSCFRIYVDSKDYACYGKPASNCESHTCKLCGKTYYSQEFKGPNGSTTFYNNARNCPKGKYTFCDDLNLGPIEPCGCKDKIYVDDD
jgi:hypothetical protein